MKPNNEDYAGLLKELRPISYDTHPLSINGTIMLKAADALEAVLAERDALKAELAAANTRMSKLDFERTAAELERDALLARLAPVKDEALVEIAAKAISTYVPDQVSKWGSIKDAAIDAIAAIRPHIEAAERERCAKIVEGACTATNNPLIVKILHGNYQSLVDRDFKIAAAIRSEK